MDDKRPRSPDDSVSFGQELRREREVRDVTLEEISAATKISVRTLAALENDQFASLPAPVFTKGFIREFSRYLGLDPEKMVNSYTYHRQQKETENTVVRKQRETEERAVSEMRHTLESRRWLVLFIAAVLIVGLVLLALFMRKSLFGDAGRTESGPGLAATAAASWSARPASPATAGSAQPSPEVVLRLEFIAASWIELVVDGRAQISELIPAGTTREFRASNELVMTLGNAGGVRGEVNGKPVPPLGKPGQVVRSVRIDRDGVHEAPLVPPQPVRPEGSHGE